MTAIVVTPVTAIIPAMFFVVAPAFISVIPSELRHILLVIPIVLHKINRLVAGVVPAAVLTPVFCMSRWHVQVDRLPWHKDRRFSYDYRLRVDQHRWWTVAKVDTTIKAGLTDADL